MSWGQQSSNLSLSSRQRDWKVQLQAGLCLSFGALSPVASQRDTWRRMPPKAELIRDFWTHSNVYSQKRRPKLVCVLLDCGICRKTVATQKEEEAFIIQVWWGNGTGSSETGFLLRPSRVILSWNFVRLYWAYSTGSFSRGTIIHSP